MVREVQTVSFAARGRGFDSVKNDNDNGDKNRTIRARQRALGRELRRIYDNVAQEPVPVDFMDLLRKMDDGKDDQS
jgi:hypothetical protein